MKFRFSHLLVFTVALLIISCTSPVKPLKSQSIHSAAVSGNTRMIEVLLARGVDVNSRDQRRGWTALLFATEAGHLSVVRLLIKNGANVNLGSMKDKVTPLMRAASNGYFDIVKHLVINKAKLNLQDRRLQSTALMWAAFKGHTQIVDYLLENKALIGVRGGRGESALWLAVSHANVKTVNVLLLAGANPNRVDWRGVSPYHLAVKKNKIEMIELLNEFGGKK